MTITRNDEVEKVANDAFVAGCATGISQVTRTLSTYSCTYTSPIKTIKKALPNIFNGLHINIGRGSMATGIQLYVKDIGQELYGFVGGVSAAAFSGASVAAMLETPLTRKSLNAKSYFYFSKVLTAMYLFRELTFSTAVLVKGNLSKKQQDALLVFCGITTAGLQKFIITESARDRLPAGITAPDFKQGIMKTLYAMGNGEYNHRAFNAPFPSPSTSLAKFTNVLWQLSGGPNAIAFRIVHLLFFREMLRFSESNLSLNNVHGFFQKKVEGGIKTQEEVKDNNSSLSLSSKEE